MFRAKRFPHGGLRKLKAWFCVRGDKHEAGVDYFKTYFPVVSWTTIWMMLALSTVLGLKTKQVDFSNAFAQAELHEDEDVYVQLPQDFDSTLEGDFVLRLNKSLYGLNVAPL